MSSAAAVPANGACAGSWQLESTGFVYVLGFSFAVAGIDCTHCCADTTSAIRSIGIASKVGRLIGKSSLRFGSGGQHFLAALLTNWWLVDFLGSGGSVIQLGDDDYYEGSKDSERVCHQVVPLESIGRPIICSDSRKAQKPMVSRARPNENAGFEGR
jgi:hypothetical protein